MIKANKNIIHKIEFEKFVKSTKFINEMPNLCMVFDLSGKILMINKVGAKYLGSKSSGLLGKSLYSILPEIKVKMQKRHKKIVASGRSQHFEDKIKMPTGKIYHFASTLKPLKNKKNNVFAIQVVSCDITNLKSAEKVIAEKEKLCSGTMEGSVIPIFVIDNKHKIISWNSACEKFSGLTFNSVIGTSLQWKAFYPKKRPVLADLIVDGINKKEIQKWYNHKDKIKIQKSNVLPGAYFGIDFFPNAGKTGKWVSFTAAPIKDKKGKIIGAVETVEDITERKIAEEKYRLLMEQSPYAIQVMTPDGNIVQVNDAYAELWGVNKKELKVIHGGYNIFKDDQLKRLRLMPYIKKAFTGKTVTLPPFEYEPGKTKSARIKGRKRWIQSSMYSIEDSKNRIRWVVMIHEDITKNKEAEEELLKYEYIISSSTDMMALLNSNFTYLVSNKAYTDAFGIEEGGITGKTVIEVFGKGIFEKVIKPNASKCIKERRDINYADWFNFPKTGKRYMNVTYSPFFDKDKNLKGFTVVARDITERKQSEEELVKEKKIFEDLFNNINSGAAIYKVLNDGKRGKDYIIESFNKKSLELEGKTIEEVGGKSLYDLRPNIDNYGLIPEFRKVWKTGKEKVYPTKIYVDKNFSNYYENKIFRLPNKNIVAIYDDVTGRKRIEEELEEREKTYTLAMKKTGQVVYDYNLKTGQIKWYGAYKEVLGYSTLEMEKVNIVKWKKLMHKDDRSKTLKILEESEKKASKYLAEYRYKKKNGDYIYMKSKGSYLRGANGKLERLIGAMEDISKQKIAEEKLIENERAFRGLYNNLPGVAYRCKNDRHWTMLFMSSAVKNITGYMARDLINNKVTSYEKIIYPADRGFVRRVVSDSIKNNKYFELEYRIVTKKGEIKWVLERGASAKNGEVYIDGIIFDITERKKMEYELKVEKNLSQKYLDLVGVMIVVLDKNGKILLINRKGIEILECSGERIVGKNWYKNFLPKELRGEVKKVVREVIEGKVESAKIHENEILTAKGQRRIISWKNSSIRGEDGQVISIISSGEDVTEKRKIEKELIKREEQYRTVVEFANDIILYLSPGGEIIEANEAVNKILKFEKNYFVGKKLKDLKKVITKESLDLILSNFKKRISGENITPYVVDLTSSNGERLKFEISASVLKTKKKAFSIIAILRDVTQREKSKAAIKESESKFRSIFETANDAIFIMKKDRFIDCNEKTLKVFACRRDQIIGHSPYKFSPPKQENGKSSKGEALKKIKAAFTKGPQYFEWNHIKCDGELFNAEVGLNKITLKGEDYLQAIVRDVTKRKEQEKKIKESEEKFRTLFEGANDAIFIMKGNKFIDCNKKSLEIFACNREDIIGSSPDKFSPYRQSNGQTSRARALKIEEEAQTKGPQHFEWDHIRKDGTPFSAEVVINKVVINEEIFLQAITRDITKRKKSEKDLQESEERLRVIIESIGDGVFVVDRDLKILMFNKRATVISGYSNEEVIGKPYNEVLKFINEDSQKDLSNFIVKGMKHDYVSKIPNHTQLIRKDGTKIYIGDSAAPLRDESGFVLGGVVVFRDITEEMEVDKAKSEFISVASHQLKTPLSGIKWLTELLLNEKIGHLNEEQGDFVRKIRESNQRLIDLVTDLLDVSHIETKKKFDIQKKRFNICKLIDNLVRENSELILNKKIKIDIEKSCLVDGIIFADKDKIYQVMNNLLVNAVKYSDPGSEIFIGLKKRDNQVIFYVKDNGIGIAKKDFDKVFLKFYRSDEAVKLETDGTGLGLYIAQAIIEAHGGKMWFESQKGKGTTFYFSLKK